MSTKSGEIERNDSGVSSETSGTAQRLRRMRRLRQHQQQQQQHQLCPDHNPALKTHSSDDEEEVIDIPTNLSIFSRSAIVLFVPLFSCSSLGHLCARDI